VEADLDINLDEWASESLNIKKKEKKAEPVEPIEKVETSEDIIKEVEVNNAEQERVKKAEERKKKRILGLLGKR
jgi:hypothetical protein